MEKLRWADQEGEAAGRGAQFGGGGEEGREARHGSQSNEGGLGRRQGFNAGRYYIDVRQCKGADCFAEKGGFLVIRFDHRQVDTWGPDFDWQAGEAGSATDVKDADSCRAWFGQQVAGEEKGFSEVTGHDLFGVADRSQVDAGVPAEQ